MKAGDTLHPLRQAGLGQASPVGVLDVHVVMGLGPVMAYENLPHRYLLSSSDVEPEATSSFLWFSARGTSSHQLSKVHLTARQAHDLELRLKALAHIVLTCRRLGHSLLVPILEAVDPH